MWTIKLESHLPTQKALKNTYYKIVFPFSFPSLVRHNGIYILYTTGTYYFFKNQRSTKPIWINSGYQKATGRLMDCFFIRERYLLRGIPLKNSWYNKTTLKLFLYDRWKLNGCFSDLLNIQIVTPEHLPLSEWSPSSGDRGWWRCSRSRPWSFRPRETGGPLPAPNQTCLDKYNDR